VKDSTNQDKGQKEVALLFSGFYEALAETTARKGKSTDSLDHRDVFGLNPILSKPPHSLWSITSLIILLLGGSLATKGAS
jgi:hypothetical protein